jgi:outer membrane receptor for ferrienterochelin and colicin
MKASVISSILVFLACVNMLSQERTDSLNRQLTEKLGVEDLHFSNDSVEMSVISASRSSKRIGDLPITIYVVTHEDILRNQYYSLTDVLKNLPGIRVSQPGSGELGESFQLRGLTGNLYTKILVNGLPVKPSAVIGMPILYQLPIRQAERIEVIYGPAAAVYGADAVSGVINIILREADKGTFVLGDVSLGQGNFRNSDFMVGGKAGKNKNILQYSFYGGLNEISDMKIKNGYEQVYNPLNYPQEKGFKYNIGGTDVDPINVTRELLNSYGINTVSFIHDNYMINYEGSLLLPSMEDLPAQSSLLGFQLKFRGISLSFNNMYRRSHSSLGQSPFFYKYNNPQNYWGENIRSTTLSYNHEWTPRFSTTTNFSDLIYSMDNNSSMGITFIDYTDKVYRYAASNDILFEQLFTVIPVNQLEIISGISYQYSGNLPQTNFLDAPFNPHDYGYFSTSIDLNYPVSGKFGLNPLIYHNYSIFSQAYYSIKSFRLMGGIRFDKNSLYGTSVSPRIAALYVLNPKTSFRGSLGYAFKAPPSSMAFQSLAFKAGMNHDSLKYIAIPNPDLEPEKYMSVELGLVKTYGKRVNLNISFYYNSIKNLILDRYVRLTDLNLPLAIIDSDTASVLTKTNERGALSRLYGLQANIKINDIVSSIKMNAEISLTFAKSSHKVPNLFDIAGSFLSDFKLMPNHFGQLRVSMEPTRNLYIQITSIWESSWLRVILPFKELYSEFIKNADGFYSMDLVADYKIGNNLSSFLKVTNVFDERYGGPVYSGMNTPLPYSPQTGRHFQIGLTYTLN